MKKSSKLFLAAAGIAGILAAGAAWAYPPAGPAQMPPCYTAGGPGMGYGPRAMAEADFSAISSHVEKGLKITSDQKPAFDRWFAAWKDLATMTPWKNAKDITTRQQALEARAAFAKERADKLSALASARGDFVKSLSDEQKSTFERYEFGHGYHRFHRGGMGMGPGCGYGPMPAPGCGYGQMMMGPRCGW